jgi:purine-nucleoside phosphorylase
LGLTDEPIEDGIIRPLKRKNDPSVGADAIMVMIPPDLDYLISVSRAKKEILPGGYLFDLYRTEDGLLTLVGPFLGAPQSVIGLEKLIALGAERIWVLGYCGSIQSNLRIGDLVIPTKAVSEEGTSAHYPIGHRVPAADHELNGMLEEALKGMGRSFHRGPVWTTDAPFRETPSKVRRYRSEGVLAVEMEMAALMTVALFRTASLSGLLVVSDELFEMKWHTGFTNPRLKEASCFAADLLLTLIGSWGG